MIVFDLECRTSGHRFEGWFSSSQDYADQLARGYLTCPQCGSAAVDKAPMAPSIGRKGNQMSDAAPAGQDPAIPAKPQPMRSAAVPMPPEAVRMMQALATMQAEALKQSRWAGDSFAEEARAMHYGERDVEPIHGQATLAEAKELLDEGIEVAPLPFPVAPPGKAN